MPDIKPRSIAVHTEGATHPVASRLHYASNLTVSADHVASLQIDSLIAGGIALQRLAAM